ncbi:DUF943 family protein [Siccibacter colletis]|uniref:DUF943 family protein n=1 Tax=Siccibacter colletis TaxID=1505757 RepID=UPI003CED2D22
MDGNEVTPLKHKLKVAIVFMIITLLTLLVYRLVLLMKPVNVAYVRSQHNASDIVVDNFPFTESGRLAWWKENKRMLEEKFAIPAIDKTEEAWSVTFWNYGEGFKQYKDDGGHFLNPFYKELYCFDDIADAKKCIDKDVAMIVSRSSTGKIFFTFEAGYYCLNSKGEIIKAQGYSCSAGKNYR